MTARFRKLNINSNIITLPHILRKALVAKFEHYVKKNNPLLTRTWRENGPPPYLDATAMVSYRLSTAFVRGARCRLHYACESRQCWASQQKQKVPEYSAVNPCGFLLRHGSVEAQCSRAAPHRVISPVIRANRTIPHRNSKL